MYTAFKMFDHPFIHKQTFIEIIGFTREKADTDEVLAALPLFPKG